MVRWVIMAMNMKKKQLIYNIISVVALILVFTFATLVIGPKLIATVTEPAEFKAFIDNNLAVGIIVFLAIQIFQVFFALIPGEPIEVFAGYGFGGFLGTLLCLAGILLASAAIFSLTRKFGKKFTYIVFAEDKLNSLKFMQSEEKIEFTIFLLFFIPGTPKDLLTYFAGLTKIGMKRFLVISTVARIPSIISSTFAGHYLMQENYLVSAIIFGVTAIVSICGIIFHKKYRQRKQDKQKEKDLESSQ